MTTFEGHILPGYYFLTVGLLWSVKYPLKYFMQHKDKKFTSNKNYQYLELLEGIAKVIMAAVGKDHNSLLVFLLIGLLYGPHSPTSGFVNEKKCLPILWKRKQNRLSKLMR